GSTRIEDNPLAPVDNDLFVNVFALKPSSEASLSEDECRLDIHLMDGHVFAGGISDEDSNSLDTGNRVGQGKDDIIDIYLNKKNMFACFLSEQGQIQCNLREIIV
nr:hypothetical protein [Tanacetum cinerariifolium]